MDFDDSDNFNAFDGADLDLDALQYPDGNNAGQVENQENEPGEAELALNDFGARKRRRNDDENVPEGQHPLDWHMRCQVTCENPEAKRFKQLQEETIIERTKQRIREAEIRKAGQAIGQASGMTRKSKYASMGLQNEVLKQPPVDGSNWIGFSDCDTYGRMYLRWRKDRMTMTIRDLDDSLNDYKRDQILFNGEKIREIFQEARKIKEAQQDFQRECQEMEKQREEGRNQTDRENPESPEIEELQEEGKKKKDGAELWARKYAPQGYADLLSDDAVNRNSITWLRLWDECVFKRRHTVQAIESRLNDRERMTFSMENRFGNRARRPHFKILLLTGPAGSGKTTLAGAIARLCGYATVELNASDSRNAPDFEKAIDGALRNQYTIDNGNKPNCLILDEIDGAPADAIKFLARTIQGTGKKAIKRPIIAICNSLFTTSLRELRPLCLVLNVNAMRRERLVERLQKIAQIENVNIDTFSLEKLVELTECDVRSSLNTLQLLANSNQGKRITAKQVEQAAESSVQNANKSLFEAFSMVLEFSRHLDNKGHLFSMKQRLQRIERVAIDQGDDRFVAGLHANYTAVNLPIGTLNRAANTFTFWDTINQKVTTTQNYSLMKYMIVFYAKLHMIVATHAKTHFQIPQSDFQMLQKSKACIEVLSTLRGSRHAGLSALPLLFDVYPYLVQIVQPAMRAANETLYTKKEKDQIEHTVQVMIDYSLTFVPTTIDNDTKFVFQPSIDQVVQYPVTSSESSGADLPNAARQMIAKKIELIKLGSSFSAISVDDSEDVPERSETPGGSSRMKQIEEQERNKNCSRTETPMPETSGTIGQVHYKYNQGFSNAVKKPVRMMDLLN